MVGSLMGDGTQAPRAPKPGHCAPRELPADLTPNSVSSFGLSPPLSCHPQALVTLCPASACITHLPEGSQAEPGKVQAQPPPPRRASLRLGAPCGTRFPFVLLCCSDSRPLCVLTVRISSFFGCHKEIGVPLRSDLTCNFSPPDLSPCVDTVPFLS